MDDPGSPSESRTRPETGGEPKDFVNRSNDVRVLMTSNRTTETLCVRNRTRFLTLDFRPVWGHKGFPIIFHNDDTGRTVDTECVQIEVPSVDTIR